MADFFIYHAPFMADFWCKDTHFSNFGDCGHHEAE